MVLQKKEFASSIDFPAKDERVIRYLKGETVDVSDLECGKEKGLAARSVWMVTRSAGENW